MAALSKVMFKQVWAVIGPQDAVKPGSVEVRLKSGQKKTVEIGATGPVTSNGNRVGFLASDIEVCRTPVPATTKPVDELVVELACQLVKEKGPSALQDALVLVLGKLQAEQGGAS